MCNSNLLYHASVPLNEDGSFKHVRIGKKEYWGHKLLQKTDQLIRTAYFDEDGSEEKNFALDYMWYMWCGPDAPSFDKDKMATFERYFIADKALHKENKGYYYTLRNRADICDNILAEFGVEPGPHSHIINGHVPVKTIKGERPIKADGKLLVIDGGFSKAYQPKRVLRAIRWYITRTACSWCSMTRSRAVRKRLKRDRISSPQLSSSNSIRSV